MDFAHAHFFAAAWRNKSRATLRKNLLESRNYFLLTQRRETELLLEAKKRVSIVGKVSSKVQAPVRYHGDLRMKADMT